MCMCVHMCVCVHVCASCESLQVPDGRSKRRAAGEESMGSFRGAARRVQDIQRKGGGSLDSREEGGAGASGLTKDRFYK